ncbi:MAG TPA: hydroxyacid dehydrogenase [Planctomycetaceae bacterium]|nr:hydroxyacid dehydrogenase [Planctomycetaceae bacterium]
MTVSTEFRVAVFSTRQYDRESFGHALRAARFDDLQLMWFETRLSPETVSLAAGCAAVCVFVCDDLSAPVVQSLHALGVRLLVLRSAGFNHVDLAACRRLGIAVARVPAYSPYAVAEHAVCLLLTLNRHVHRAWQRVRELNFSLDGLTGFDVHGRTVGVIGTGRIGTVFTRIMTGFGARVLAYDPQPAAEIQAMPAVQLTDLEQLIEQSDIISLHCPLTEQSRHMINADRLSRMKPGVMLLNTSRGGLIDTKALIQALKSGRIGAAGLDVYEEEEGIFFSDLSESGLQDDVLARLLTFPNVLITSHQAFLTCEALQNIAERTLQSLLEFRSGAIAAEARLV